MCVACGGEDEACCAPQAGPGGQDGCPGVLRCSADVCTVCGEANQACCVGLGAACSAANTCQNELCVACGAEGEPCCRQGNQVSCSNNNLTCDNDYTCVAD
jgi:hypothetical protein